MLTRILALSALLGVVGVLNADPPTKKSPREALQAFGELIGNWRGTGQPVGVSKEEREKNWWSEKMAWEWQFKGEDAWLKVVFAKSKHFTSGEMRYVPDKDHFAFTVVNLKKEKLTFVGALENKNLILQREEDKESQQLVFNFLHSNLFWYRYKVKPEGQVLYREKWNVRGVSEDVPFAASDGKPECIVSGGRGTSTV